IKGDDVYGGAEQHKEEPGYQGRHCILKGREYFFYIFCIAVRKDDILIIQGNGVFHSDGDRQNDHHIDDGPPVPIFANKKRIDKKVVDIKNNDIYYSVYKNENG